MLGSNRYSLLIHTFVKVSIFLILHKGREWEIRNVVEQDLLFSKFSRFDGFTLIFHACF